MLPEVVLGGRSGLVVCGELAHAGTATDVSGNDRYGGFVDQQTALHRGESTALGLVQQTSNAPVEILQLDGVCHPAETLQRFTNGPHIAEVHLDLNWLAVEPLITAELEHQLVAVHPATAGVTHLDGHLVAVNGVGAVVLAIRRRSDADVADAKDFKGVAHHRKPVDQVRLDDGAGATAHHRQVHHQTEGLPIHEVGGGAVVGAGEVFGLFDPACATDPEPAA